MPVTCCWRGPSFAKSLYQSGISLSGNGSMQLWSWPANTCAARGWTSMEDRLMTTYQLIHFVHSFVAPLSALLGASRRKTCWSSVYEALSFCVFRIQSSEAWRLLGLEVRALTRKKAVGPERLICLFLICYWADQSEVFMLQPFTSKDFAIRTLADRVSDLKHLIYLFPDIPKDQAFGKYYTPFTETQAPSNGYVKPLLVTHVPG